MNLRQLLTDYIERLKHRSTTQYQTENLLVGEAYSSCADELLELLQETECGFSIPDGTEFRRFASGQKARADQITAGRRDSIITLVEAMADFYGIPKEQLNALLRVGIREGFIRSMNAVNDALLEDDLWNP